MILIMLYQKDKGTSLKFLFWIMLDIYKRVQNSELDLQTTKIFFVVNAMDILPYLMCMFNLLRNC